MGGLLPGGENSGLRDYLRGTSYSVWDFANKIIHSKLGPYMKRLYV